MFRRKKLLSKDDYDLDRNVWIKGTQYDRKRKLTDDQVSEARKLVKQGWTSEQLSILFNVSEFTIKYNTDSLFREQWLKQHKGKHYGKVTCNFKNRVLYKRYLLMRKKV